MSNADPSEAVVAAFTDAVAFFSDRLDAELVTRDGRLTGETANDYFREARGWTDETIQAAGLGWAPADPAALLTHLRDAGHSEIAILGTGLFYPGDGEDDDPRPHFQARYVFPYFDSDGRPVYAITRTADHPNDPKRGHKYTKAIKQPDYARVAEPLYGLQTVTPRAPVIVTEGIADAITAHQHGYPCVSPVTTTFKLADVPRLRKVLAERGIERVYVVQDAERPTHTLETDDGETTGVHLEQYGAGVTGAVRTGVRLADADGDDTQAFDVRLGHLPRPGVAKVDVDDYLREWAGADGLGPVLRSAKPVTDHPLAETLEQRAKRGGLEVGDGRPQRASTVSRGYDSDDYPDCPLNVYDVLSRDNYPEGKRVEHPFHGSDTDRNFRVFPGGNGWYCYRCKVGGNALHLLGMKYRHFGCGDWIGPNGDRGAVPNETWADVLADAEGDGYDLEGLGSDERNEVAFLPTLETLGIGVGSTGSADDWGPLTPDIRDTVEDTDCLTRSSVWQRTLAGIALDLERGDRTLRDTPPSGGKTYGFIGAVAETDRPATLVVPRGKREQYDELTEYAGSLGLETLVLPSVYDLCPTFRGEAGEEWQARVEGAYTRGVAASGIHSHAEDWFGQPLPCNRDGDCPYSSAWSFDADEYDLLIGHYTHLYVPGVVMGRAIGIDEFPEDAFTTSFDTATTSENPNLDAVLTAFCRDEAGFPFENATDLSGALTDPDGHVERLAEAIVWLRNRLETTDDLAATNTDGHAHAAYLVYAQLVAHAPVAVLEATDAHRYGCGEGWRRVTLRTDGYGVVGSDDTEHHHGVHLTLPPSFDGSSAVVALDGTPTPELWEATLSTGLKHRPVFDTTERTKYVRDTLDLRIVQTTENARPNSSGNFTNPARTAALLRAIRNLHGRVPDGFLANRNELLALLRAHDATFPDDLLPEYQRDPTTGKQTDSARWFGDLLGSNRLNQARLGVVSGSPHYGDGYIKRKTALVGGDLRTPDRSSPEQRGMGLSYGGGVADRILRHVRENHVAQAILRFGRDGGGATVYVDTAAIPDWIPIAADGRVLRTRTDDELAVIDACCDLASAAMTDGNGSWTRADVEAHPSVDCSTRTVRRHLKRLTDEGLLERERIGRKFAYREATEDGLLEDCNIHGCVSLSVESGR